MDAHAADERCNRQAALLGCGSGTNKRAITQVGRMNSPLIIDRWSTPKISLRASDGQWIVSATSSQQDQLCWQVLSRDKALELVDILSKMYRPIDLKLWMESERLPLSLS